MEHQIKPTVMILGSHHLAGWDGGGARGLG